MSETFDVDQFRRNAQWMIGLTPVLRNRILDACDEIERLRKALNQTDHVVILSDDGWSVEHLVECRRIPNGMTKCAVHEALNVFSEELLDDHGFGRFRLIGWDDDYPMLAALSDTGGEG